MKRRRRKKRGVEKIGVVAFAFGTPQTITPNMILGQHAERAARMYNAAIFTQTDILILGRHDVTYAQQDHGNMAPSTLSVARQAIAWAHRRNITTLHVVAARPHTTRVFRDLHGVIAEKRSTANLRRVRAGRWNTVWFSALSEQLRTNYPLIWYIREKILLSMSWRVYKILAG